MTDPVDDPRRGTAGTIPSGTDLGSAAPAESGGASGSGAIGESTSTGGASASGAIGAASGEESRDDTIDAPSGGASGSSGVSDTPDGASASSDLDEDQDSNA